MIIYWDSETLEYTEIENQTASTTKPTNMTKKEICIFVKNVA